MKIGEEFHPSPKMMILYVLRLMFIMIPLYAFGIGITLLIVYYFPLNYFWAEVFALTYLLPLTIIMFVTLYWIPKYYKSIRYLFNETEVRVEGGVWWRERHAIPYSRVMNVDTIQGPLSKRYGLGTVDIYTAGYTGRAGGSGGPSTRRAEASIINVEDFIELREQVLEVVRGRPLFGAITTTPNQFNEQILEELKAIKKLMEAKS